MIETGKWTNPMKSLLSNASRVRASALFLGTSLAMACTGVPAKASDAVPSGPPRLQEWAATRVAPKGAPNVIIIMTDDVGFGASSTFGGPIPTPNLDRLADRGLRFNRFHTTAICSSTRAALLTGRNHNAVGMGVVPEFASDNPGYSSIMPASQPTIADILRANGYSTAMIGKSHLTPMWQQGPMGPFEQWPTGLGFDHFYGFLGGETDQFSPALYENTSPVTPPHDKDYILDKDLADQAIKWIRLHANSTNEQPFFLYYATGTAHTPLQAPREWIEKFKGAFDMGWDRLRELTLKKQIAAGVVPPGTRLASRPPGIPEWDTLPEKERRIYAREMEVYAAMLAYADNQIGRVLSEVDALGMSENTMVIFIQGDNGASAEGGISGALNRVDSYNGMAEDKDWMLANIDKIGGPETSPHYAAGWAMAMDTPFPWMKQYASHLGGIRNGMVVSWPARIQDNGKIRTRYSHVVDILPTVIAAAGLSHTQATEGLMKERVEDGLDISADFFAENRHPSTRTQYYDMFGNAGIYKDGWFAGTTPVSVPWNVARQQKAPPFPERKWELYDLDRDFSQSTDIASSHPDKLEELKALYLAQAKKNNAIPGLGFSVGRRWEQDGDPQVQSFTGPVSGYPASLAPDVMNRSFSIKANVSVPADAQKIDGVIVTQGGFTGGYALYVQDGTPVFFYNGAAAGNREIRSSAKLRSGSNEIVIDFASDGGSRGQGGTLSFVVNGKAAGSGPIARTVPILFSGDDTFDIGSDSGTPVTENYSTPNSFTGEVKQVVFTLGKQLAPGPVARQTQ